MDSVKEKINDLNNCTDCPIFHDEPCDGGESVGWCSHLGGVADGIGLCNKMRTCPQEIVDKMRKNRDWGEKMIVEQEKLDQEYFREEAKKLNGDKDVKE